MLLITPVHKEMFCRVLYDFFHSPSAPLLSYEIEQGKEEDPDKIDQMPVQSAVFKQDIIVKSYFVP
jgi:hypothetical protein